MTDDLDLFAPAAHIALRTLSAGPIKHAHKAQQTGDGRRPGIDEPLASIDDGVLRCRYQRQSAIMLAHAPNVGATAPTGALIERP
ncbi:hypothetical protein LMTR3_21550 [Bradyrhizobium sp. LMTR 3]|nr:hypothetical protein LMTR3_21550 [Bradyrhizobium sp. LMTR 3]